jgi:NAD(P)-dependent dehydrogenase (short-subunit alcohol dehydrogenase family)
MVPAEEAKARLQRLGLIWRKILYLLGDTAKQEISEHIIAQALERFGSVDMCIDNAAVVEPCPFLDLTPESWTR